LLFFNSVAKRKLHTFLGRKHIRGERGMCGGQDRCIQVVVGKHEKNQALRTPMRKWEDNIKIDLHEVEWGEWIGLIRLRMGIGGGLL
jgi:hypothetical protein